jgi:hypothetical protein
VMASKQFSLLLTLTKPEYMIEFAVLTCIGKI